MMYSAIGKTAEYAGRLLGLHVVPASLSFSQMALRGLVVFLFGTLIVRLGDRRLLGKNATFDMLLLVILGSVLSRAVNGQAAFLPTLGVSGLLVLFHHLAGVLSCHFPVISKLVKGQARVVIKDGVVDPGELMRCRISPDDLDENLRLNGNVCEIREIKEARLERNGTISVVRRKD
ncbi:MAG TPA: YetF domain-containing protein [Lacunisphaera sp.]|jgi:uncharacterized membrane protein YcaP (DUF421 family)